MMPRALFGQQSLLPREEDAKAWFGTRYDTNRYHIKSRRVSGESMKEYLIRIAVISSVHQASG